MCNELTNDTQSSINKHFIMSICAVCFSVIKSCTYWDSSTIQALHEHACLFYEKCNVDRVGKMPSNITIYDAEIKIKYSHLNQGSFNTALSYYSAKLATVSNGIRFLTFFWHFFDWGRSLSDRLKLPRASEIHITACNWFDRK